MELVSNAPTGPIEQAWDNHKFELKLVNPANKRKYNIIVVGTGLAGGAAAASLGELGYNVKCFCYQDSPRRAHSIAAQGGINAAKNYQNDGDSVYRLFYDTVKGGDFRAREANVYRLAQVSVNIIDQCVAQGVPFAREYGGLLDNRSFGGAQVSRTFYARGQTGQQLLLGAYQALERQIGLGPVKMHPRTEMLDLVVVDGQARGIVARNLVTRRDRSPHRPTPSCSPPAATATSSTSPPTPRAATPPPSGAPTSAAPVSPTPASRRSTRPASRSTGDYQSKLTLMSESLRNDGRIWVPKKPGDKRAPAPFPKSDRDYYLERSYPSLRQPRARATSPPAPPRRCATRAAASAKPASACTSISPTAIQRLGKNADRERYGNLFDMYERITGEDPYEVPDAHLPRHPLHHGRPLGGLQPDDHHPRPVRPRRSQLLRPRRQPPRRQRAHAGPGRRLLHHPLHHRQLPRHRQARQGRRRCARREASRGKCLRHHKSC